MSGPDAVGAQAPPAVRRAAAADVGAVAAALADATLDDPWIGWVVAADRRHERVAGLQSSLLGAVGVPYGEVWLAEREGAVVGAALWLLADRPVPPTAWAQVAAMEAELMGDRHASAVAAAAATRHLRPLAPHHLLATLGVRPGERTRGVGTALLAPVLDRADRQGVDAYLETSAERNLRFYGRLGFAVTEQVRLPAGPAVWAMLRLPRAAPATPAAIS